MAALMHKRRMRWIPATMVCEVRGPAPVAALKIPQDAAQFFLENHDATEEREVFKVALLNVRGQVQRLETVSVGCRTSTLVHPREVFKAAVTDLAAAIVVSHNHPSGDPEPSQEDIALTRRLVSAGTLMGIEVLDHIIITSTGRWVSLKDRGVM